MQEKKRWKGIKSIGMVCKTIIRNDEKITKKRYYICSFISNIELLAKSIRKHWSIEIMHWHLDVTFKEDDNTTLDKVATQNLNIINKWCLSILKIFEIGNKKRSIRNKRFYISMNVEKYLTEIMKI